MGANSLKSHIRGRPEGKFILLPQPPIAKLLFGADKRDVYDVETLGDSHGGLAFGGIRLVMCILELDFPVTVADQLQDGASGKQLTPGSQHAACAVPQPAFQWSLSLTMGSVWALTLTGFRFVPAG